MQLRDEVDADDAAQAARLELLRRDDPDAAAWAMSLIQVSWRVDGYPGTDERRDTLARRRLITDANEHCRWCALCGSDIEPDAPVWRRPLYMGRSITAVIRTLVAPVCAAHLGSRRHRIAECFGCGRLVYLTDRRSRRRPTCCLACSRDALSRERRAKRQARILTCGTCEAFFTPRVRGDSQYCSSACRQKAYRTRKAER